MSYKIRTNYLTPNRWSRPQKSATIDYICVHWEVSINARADAVRDFFESRKYGDRGYGSAHEICDTDGSILIVIPNDEMAYSVGAKSYKPDKYKLMGDTYPNSVVYSIEFPTVNSDGDFSEVVYQTMVERVVDLLIENNLTPDKVITHGMLCYKDCSKYFCPTPYRVDYGRWNKYIGEVIRMYDEKKEKNKEKEEFDKANWEGSYDAWEWSEKIGMLDGNNPDGKMTRLMYAQSIYNLFVKNKELVRKLLEL